MGLIYIHSISSPNPTMITILVNGYLLQLGVMFKRLISKLDMMKYPTACLFTCKLLRTLKLDIINMGEAEWDIPDSICLPVLKTLYIRSIRFSGGERISKLFSTCPVLETLIISQCVLTKPAGDISISAFHLNKLVIEDLNPDDDNEDSNQNWKITVCTPNLTSFTCKGYALKDYTLLNFSSRVNAIIHVGLASFYDWGSNLELSPSEEQKIQIVINCLRGLCSVRSLTVDVWLLEAIFEGPASLGSVLSPFYNLTSLKLLTSLSRYRIHTVTGFLGKCPNLETLLLKMTESPFWEHMDKLRASAGEELQYWKMELPLPCMEYHLKFVEIQDATGSANELEFLKFVLKNAMVLEQITIATLKEQSPTQRRLECLMKLRKELETIPKASSSIKISFL